MIFENVRFLNESDIVWDYITDIDYSVFEEIENRYGVRIPHELKSLFNEYNNGVPNKQHFKLRNGEGILSGIFSLNKDEKYNVYFYLDMMKDLNYNNYFPIGNNYYGGTIYYNMSNKNIEIYDEEQDKFYKISDNLKSFIKSLYK